MGVDKAAKIETDVSIPGMSARINLGFREGDRASLATQMVSSLSRKVIQLLSAGATGVSKSAQLAHDEDTFRFLLANEMKRFERSGRSFHILLTYFSGLQEEPIRMDGQTARVLVAVLSEVLRETDYVGWCKNDHVLGGVLTAIGDLSIEEVSSRVERRFWWQIERESPMSGTGLRVCFIRPQELGRIDKADWLGLRRQF